MTGTDTPAPAAFSAQLLGQTEKTLNALLARLLADRVSEPEWVTLVLAAAAGPSRAAVIARVASALRVSQETAAGHLARLAAGGLVTGTAGSQVALTDSGAALLGSVRAGTGEITGRLWGDLPRADLDAAGRVLSTILARADAELAAR
jgi:DNA-binding MarR family transcriptional regulator